MVDSGEDTLGVVWQRIFQVAVSSAWIAVATTSALAERSGENTRPNIILISVDTLRADHLSCYSPTARKTPNIDRISQGGTILTQVSSLVPLTLPSHTAILTSTYPFVSGVEDNGDHLTAGSVTLATSLHANGYRTAAFVSGFVLDKRFGLDQGFDTYEGPPESQHRNASDPGDIKRRGGDTAKAAQQWVLAKSAKPFFLFLHIYDLHTPYDLSVAEKAKYGDGYEGELGYIDDVIGKFWSQLDAQGLIEKSLIVFTSDHGEGLGDHGENTHGFFIYQSTLHVPLIIHWPGHSPGAALLPDRVDAPASLLDVAPTTLTAARLRVPTAFQGRSLMISPEVPRDVYSESVYPQKHFDASALSSLRRGRYKYIEAPRPEFFDLDLDPGESNNLYAAKGTIASAYRERLKQLREQYKPASTGDTKTLSPEAVERLHALGYMAGGGGGGGSKLNQVDPKDRIGAYETYGRAIELASAGRLDEADRALTSILESDPNLSDVRLSLGLNEQRLGRDAEALREFQSVLTAEPASAIAHYDAALSYYNLRQWGEAARELSAALVIAPDYLKAQVLQAKTLVESGHPQQGAAAFEHILQANPDDYEAHDGMGTLAAMEGHWDESIKQLQTALVLEPGAAETHNTLGSVYLRKGEAELARKEFDEAVKLRPSYAQAHYNLGLVMLQSNDREGARGEFKKAVSADPLFRPALDALARLEQSQ